MTRPSGVPPQRDEWADDPQEQARFLRAVGRARQRVELRSGKPRQGLQKLAEVVRRLDETGLNRDEMGYVADIVKEHAGVGRCVDGAELRWLVRWLQNERNADARRLSALPPADGREAPAG